MTSVLGIETSCDETAAAIVSDGRTVVASVIASQPASIQLRYLQTLTEIAVEKNSTIIFPVPIEFIRGLGDLFQEIEQQD